MRDYSPARRCPHKIGTPVIFEIVVTYQNIFQICTLKNVNAKSGLKMCEYC